MQNAPVRISPGGPCYGPLVQPLQAPANPHPFTLSDSFSGASLDTTKWSVTTLSGGHSITQSGGDLVLAPVVNYGAGSFTSVTCTSVNTYDLTNDFFYASIGDLSGMPANEVITFFLVNGTDSVGFQFQNSGGSTHLFYWANGFLFNDPFDPASHGWLAIDYVSPTQFQMLTAPPSTTAPARGSGSWTNRIGPQNFPGTLSPRAVQPQFQVGSSDAIAAGSTPVVGHVHSINAPTSTANAYSLTCGPGTFTLSGQAMTPAVAMLASTGTFALTGNAMTPAVSMAAARGTFTLTGNAITPAVAMPAATGSFSITGNAATLTHGYPLVASTGVFTLTGRAAGLPVGHVLSLTTGAFSLSGQAMVPRVAMAATTGSFALTGNAAGLGVALTATTGTFTLSGIAATLRVTMPMATGVFVLTGNAAGLNKIGSSTLTAARGAFTLTGYAAGTLHAARLSVTSAQFALSGTSAALKAAHRLTAATGAFSLAGNPASALHQAKLTAATGSFAITGRPAGAARQARISADTGTFVVTGLAARIVTIVLPTPESRTVAGIVIGRTAEGSLADRTIAPNLQRRTATA